MDLAVCGAVQWVEMSRNDGNEHDFKYAIDVSNICRSVNAIGGSFSGASIYS